MQLTFCKNPVSSAIKEDSIDAPTLYIWVVKAAAGIVKGEADGILHEVWGDGLEGRIGVSVIKHVDTFNAHHTWVHKECIIVWKWRDTKLSINKQTI